MKNVNVQQILITAQISRDSASFARNFTLWQAFYEKCVFNVLLVPQFCAKRHVLFLSCTRSFPHVRDKISIAFSSNFSDIFLYE